MPAHEAAVLDIFAETALLCMGVDDAEVDEERSADSGLLSITRELRTRLDA